MTLTKQEREEIYFSISCRLGIIETGTNMRAVDAINCGKKHLVKILTSDQYPLVLSLENLMMRMLQEKDSE